MSIQGGEEILLKTQRMKGNTLYINNFNLNRGGMLRSNYPRIKHLQLTVTKKYLELYPPGNVFLFELIESNSKQKVKCK